MCVIELTEDLTLTVIYYEGDDGSVPEAVDEWFDAGEKLDVDVYDADGVNACIQFPRGPIVTGVPITTFRVVSPCHRCVDPHSPDPDPEGGFGGAAW